MLTAVKTMLSLQDQMNTKVHPQWRSQGFEWYRAAWIECGELMDHAGYKWWKHAEPELEQIQLEVVDIWHFGMSALIVSEEDLTRWPSKLWVIWRMSLVTAMIY